MIKEINKIPEIFKGQFPPNYINDVKGWGLSKRDLHTKLKDGTYKLLTLDIDFGETCSLNCFHCFRKSKELDIDAPPLSFDELVSYIKEAKKMGLKSVKFLGAGEPLEAPQLIELLEELKRLEIKPAIFTKGYILGSDRLAGKYFKSYKIETADQLIQKLKDLNVSILLGFNSFDEETQTLFVGKRLANGDNYFKLRNNALIKLIGAGFNEYVPGKATNLALIAAPIKPENIHEIFDIYQWGRRRNIYTLSCPTTFSGRGKFEFEREYKIGFEDYIAGLKELYIEIYKWNIKNGLMSLDDFREEGVSLYPGCHPCNQVAAGMYLTLKGKIIRCPGRDDKESVIIENIRDAKTLRAVWVNSFNYRLAGQTDKYNYHCIARDGYFFKEEHNFYQEVYDRVISEITQEDVFCIDFDNSEGSIFSQKNSFTRKINMKEQGNTFYSNENSRRNLSCTV